MGGQACPWRGEALDGGKGSLREREPAGEVGRRRVLRGKPVAEPAEALGRMEELPVEVDRRGVGGPRRVPLFGGALVNKLGLGNAEGNSPLPRPGLDCEKCRLEQANVGAIRVGRDSQGEVVHVGKNKPPIQGNM